MSDTVTRLAAFLPYRLSIASNAVSDLIAGEYRSRFGLKVPEWRVMAILGDVDNATQRELAHAARMDKVAVSRAVKTLVARALIRRRAHAEDGRSQYLILTDTGRELYEEIMPHALEMEQVVLSVLSDEERKNLGELLDKLLTRADEIAGS